jgi:hypothetical protein
MARYRKIDPRIWNDAKFRDLSDRAKLAFFMLLTHPHMTAIGAMRASLDGLASEIGWSAKAFREAFGEASSKGLVKHDERASILWLPNFLKYNGPESPNVVRAWLGAFDLLPESALKNQAIQSAKAFTEGLPEAFGKAFTEALAKAMPNPEPEQEPEQEQEKTPQPPDALKLNGGSTTNGHADLHAEVLGIWREVLPDLPQPRTWEADRRKKLDARIADTVRRGKPADSPDYWRALFAKVARSDFLCGRKKDWRCDLPWLLEPANFAKLIDGGYDNVRPHG